MSDGVTNPPVQRALRGIQKEGDAGQVGDSVRIRSLNAQIYISNKFILNSSNLNFKLEQWEVEVESAGRKVKIFKSEDFLVFLDLKSGND